MLRTDPSSPRSELVWRIVGLVNLYRLLAVLVLYGVHVFTQPTPAFGANHPRLFLLVVLFYLLLAIMLAVAGRKHWPNRRMLVITHTLIDTIAIATLLYTSGGTASGLAVLLILPVGSMALSASIRSAWAAP